MSAFEIACWNWYQENVNGFTLAAGALGPFLLEEGLKGAARAFFVRAAGLIYETFERVGLEKAKAAKGS
ncbi:MAG: hypothetical protein ABFD52_08820 [Acidobacteriota bacterium]